MPDLDPVALLESMVAIASPSGREARLAGSIAATLHRSGLDAEIDAVGNLLVTVGTGYGPTVLCLGHLDTVDDPLPMRREGHILYGRGTVDAKSPLAAMICAAAANRHFPGTLIIAGAVEEEVPGSRGARHLATTLHPDAVVIGEPSGWDKITVGYKGQTTIEIRVIRAGSHASHPAEKATEAATAIWQTISGMFPRDAAGPSFADTVACLHSIRGDMRTAYLLLDVRTPPGRRSADLVRELGDKLGDGVRVRVVDSIAAVRFPRTSSVCSAFATAITGLTGRPRYSLKAGTSDMNIVAEHWPVPMVAYGPGDSQLDHAPGEHIDLREYMRSVRVLSTALPQIALKPVAMPR